MRIISLCLCNQGKDAHMALINLLLSPGSAICRHYGIDPKSDVGLMRWMINTFFYLFVGLIIVWIVAV